MQALAMKNGVPEGVQPAKFMKDAASVVQDFAMDVTKVFAFNDNMSVGNSLESFMDALAENSLSVDPTRRAMMQQQAEANRVRQTQQLKM